MKKAITHLKLDQANPDLCISRPKKRLAWGIELPFDPDYVTYVWFDALTNYITAAGHGSDEGRFGRFWPAAHHLVGKDILSTHAVYWPNMLHAGGIAPPRTIFAHGWWTIEGRKMSKSVGNVVEPGALADRYGVDALRYFLMREVPFGPDGDFSHRALVGRINTDLANDLGNLLSRVLAMTCRYFAGAVPPAGSRHAPGRRGGRSRRRGRGRGRAHRPARRAEGYLGSRRPGVVIATAAEPTATPAPEATASPTLALTATLTVEPAKTPAAANTPAPTEPPILSGNAVPISAVAKDSTGQTITVRGKVVDTLSFSVGFKFLLDDGTGRLWLTLFENIYKFVPNRVGLNLGADVQVTAEVAEFQGVQELQPNSGRDVQIIEPGSSAGVPVTKINQLGKPGQLAAIEGTITDVQGFSAGANVFVDDGTGNMRVTVFNNVLAYVPRDRLVPGAAVRVYGKVGAFGGALQVVPALGYDVIFK